MEVAIDALKRSASLKPKDILKAITETDYNSLVGPITWKGGFGTGPCSRKTASTRNWPAG